jgi:DNA mismatch repair protein PMS1
MPCLFFILPNVLVFNLYADKLTFYGFRGEALSSICAVADVTVITKSDFDEYAKSFSMDSNGRVKNSSICHHQKG